MKKTYKLVDLDCANCAAKMERAIKKLPAVNDASVVFMTQKLTIDSDTDDFEALMDEVERTIAKVEPDTHVVR
ncbi:MAG: cation transporter [Oscillospiraceae bacterium]|nr:cation transporter [Oscillospiraceae bacterium]MCC8078558.1 cation transporter [Oscillospiraceae bacterium]MCD7792219.1 cation transporter [Oscillospiraceae bacterium]MCD8066673.1 cation transporter [Oscillospiraceae bacterium]MCD8100559.1 cation transporter [Oscillospiraceae bacterium]